MARDKPLVVIGICTRQRNEMLRRLIDGIQEQPVSAGYRIEILVVDNNDFPTAAPALDGVADRFPVTVEHEPQAGLVYARNHVLDVAAARDAAWIIGVDDDEWVADDWLAEMILAMETIPSPVLIGQCAYVYDDDLSAYLAPRQLQVLVKGERPWVLASSNFAIQRRVFANDDGMGMRFDPFFNESGGEDVEFFLRAERQYGWVAGGVPDSLVSEAWTGDRATLGYHLRRTLRNQVSGYQITRRHRQLGLDGNIVGNSVRAALRTNRLAVYGLGTLIGGLGLTLVNRPAGRMRVTLGLEKCILAFAIVPFLIGMTPVAYGAKIMDAADGDAPRRAFLRFSKRS
jgi:glycosyltransferase involved in cell wall biosynthesis